MGSQLLLIVNVYFPTGDGTSSSKDNLNDTLGELEGLLIAQQFDYLLVAGDYCMMFVVVPFLPRGCLILLMITH